MARYSSLSTTSAMYPPTGYTGDEEQKTFTVAAPTITVDEGDKNNSIVIALNAVLTVAATAFTFAAVYRPNQFWIGDLVSMVLSIGLLVGSVSAYYLSSHSTEEAVSAKAKVGLPVWSALLVVAFVALTVVDLKTTRRVVQTREVDAATGASVAASTVTEVKTADFDELDPSGYNLDSTETVLLSKLTCTKESLLICQQDRSNVKSTHMWIYYLYSSDKSELVRWYEDKDPAVIDCAQEVPGSKGVMLRDVETIKQRILDAQSHFMTYLLVLIAILLLVAVLIFVYIHFFKNGSA